MADLCDVRVIGRLGRFFGFSGWIRLHLVDAQVQSVLLETRVPLFVKSAQGEWSPMSVVDKRTHAGSLIVKFADYHSKEEVASLTNLPVGIAHSDLPRLAADDYYWSDLIGLEVLNAHGESFGKVKELIATGAHDVLVVVGTQRFLIPYLSTVILQVDLTNQKILVDWELDYL